MRVQKKKASRHLACSVDGTCDSSSQGHEFKPWVWRLLEKKNREKKKRKGKKRKEEGGRKEASKLHCKSQWEKMVFSNGDGSTGCPHGRQKKRNLTLISHHTQKQQMALRSKCERLKQ